MYKPYKVIERKQKGRQYSYAYHDFFRRIYPDFIKEYKKSDFFDDNVVIIERYPLRQIAISDGISPRGALNGSK
jgi:hypothetical protein